VGTISWLEIKEHFTVVILQCSASWDAYMLLEQSNAWPIKINDLGYNLAYEEETDLNARTVV
jgi:hypothetical protein